MDPKKVINHTRRGISSFFIFIVILILFFGSFFIVGSGERGIVVSKFTGTKQVSYDEGIHFKIPIIDSSKKYEVRNIKLESTASASSKDLQVVTTTVALNYRLEPENTHKLHQEIGENYQDRVIDPSIQEVVKAITATFIAEELITKRPVVKEEIKDALRDRLKKNYIVLEDLSIKNIDFSDEFDRAIELKVTAEQKALEEENRLKVVEFQAQQKIKSAEGDAKAIEIINEQLEQSPDYIKFKLLEKWNGEMPQALGASTIFSITNDE